MRITLTVILVLLVNNIYAKALSEAGVQAYFEEIALQQEFKKVVPRVKKWTSDIKIYCDGNWSVSLKNELSKIIEELKPIIGNVRINVVSNKSDANYIIFLGSALDYVNKIESKAKPYAIANYGLFWIYWNKNKEIIKGSMYVDLERANTDNWRKHLLREELTQSLGLMNDSSKYGDSIFYARQSFVTAYSKLDMALIRLLYNKNIEPNMSKEEVRAIIKTKHLLTIDNDRK